VRRSNLQNTKDKIYFNFSYEVLKLLGDGLYSNPWTAISELIANGIDAEATKIYLFINMTNKQSSTIEIFDNGYGMGYDDLVSKYAFLGKNKRHDKDLNSRQVENVLGRKGIGKLAALYLSPTFYLISRTDKEDSSWCFDMTDIQQDENPNIKRVTNVKLEVEKQWQTCKTGTLIKLVNVDLKNIGEQTLEGIKARIADYYSFNDNNLEIFIALKQNSKDKIIFVNAEKQIAFKNFYAFLNLSNSKYNELLSKEILLSTTFPESMPDTKKIKEASKDVYYKKCKVQILNNTFITSGKQKFKDENGILSAKIFNYKLLGWIGIHSTIEKREAKYNDRVFIRNKAYQPNRLRLYVRKKLAVENFMEYVHNTQAFGKYIEGEIHFDILDENELPDISTADRQDYKEDNDRIKKLVELLKPIITALIKSRVDIGHKIRKEEKDYRDAKEKEQKEKAEKAEEKARKATEAKDEADVLRKKAEDELEEEKKQNIFQRSVIGCEKEQILTLQHHIKHSASRIITNVSNLYEYFKKIHKENINQFIIKKLSTISTESENILSIAKYVTKANYNLKSTEIKEDIIRFIQEYINEMFVILDKKYPKIKIVNKNNNTHIFEFRPLEVTGMIDNFIHNAKKAKAQNITFTFLKIDNKLEIKVIDDGIGISQENINKIFNFGYTSTDGSGIGLYMVKKSVDNMKGRVEVVSQKNKGTTFKIIL
jgi:signal transduction histidine kinase